jgi:hypothetical protein
MVGFTGWPSSSSLFRLRLDISGWSRKKTCGYVTNNVVFESSMFVTLIKKKIKFSSYIRKFRMERLQSHI